MDYEILASVIESAKRIVQGTGYDEDWMDIGEWGAEVIVALDRDFGNAEEHLRKLVDALESQYAFLDNEVLLNYYRANDYLKGLEE